MRHNCGRRHPASSKTWRLQESLSTSVRLAPHRCSLLMPLLQAASPFASRPARAAEALLSHHEAQHVVDAWQASIIPCRPAINMRPIEVRRSCHAALLSAMPQMCMPAEAGKHWTLSDHAHCRQDAKAGALGRHRLTSKLAGPLAGEMLDTWTRRASYLAEKGWCARRRTNVT